MNVDEFEVSFLDVARGNAPDDAPIHRKDMAEHAAFARGDAVMLPLPTQIDGNRRGREQGNRKQPKPHRR